MKKSNIEKQQIVYPAAECVHPSPTNPRKSFPVDQLQELGDSIAEHGIIQPLIVRLLPGREERDPAHYEIVAGERRFRSGKLAGLAEYPVIVRQLTDDEVLELQLIENLQREDVSPYEEAMGYANLLKVKDADGKLKFTIDSIADRLGKSRAYVAGRLKVCQAPKKLLQALEEGLVGARICELVSRLPTAEDRERCAIEVLEPHYDNEVMTTRQVEELIAEAYVVKLSKAGFDRDDKTLLSGVADCKGCEYRTGNDKSIEGGLREALTDRRGTSQGVDPNLCQNPACFRAKGQAHLDRLKAENKKLVVPAAEAEKHFSEYGGDRLNYRSKFAVVDDKPGYDELGHYDSNKVETWGVLAAEAGVNTLAIRNPHTGTVLQVVDRNAVRQADVAKAKAAGKDSIFTSGSAADSEEAKKRKEDEKRRQELVAEEQLVFLGMVSDGLLKVDERVLALELLRSALEDGRIEMMLRWMKLKPESKPGESLSYEDKVEAVIAECEDVERYSAAEIRVVASIAQLTQPLEWHGLHSTRVKTMAALAGVEAKTVKKEAAAIVRARRAEERKAAIAKKKAASKKSASVGSGLAIHDEDVATAAKLLGANVMEDEVTVASLKALTGWPLSRATKVFDELVDRDLLINGVFQSGEPPAKKKVAKKKAVAKKKIPAQDSYIKSRLKNGIKKLQKEGKGE